MNYATPSQTDIRPFLEYLCKEVFELGSYANQWKGMDITLGSDRKLYIRLTSEHGRIWQAVLNGGQAFAEKLCAVLNVPPRATAPLTVRFRSDELVTVSFSLPVFEDALPQLFSLIKEAHTNE